MTEQIPLITPVASDSFSRYPHHYEIYVFTHADSQDPDAPLPASRLLRKALPWQRPQEKYVQEDGSVVPPGEEQGMARACRLRHISVLLGELAAADPVLAAMCERYFTEDVLYVAPARRQ